MGGRKHNLCHGIQSIPIYDGADRLFTGGQGFEITERLSGCIRRDETLAQRVEGAPANDKFQPLVGDDIPIAVHQHYCNLGNTVFNRRDRAPRSNLGTRLAHDILSGCRCELNGRPLQRLNAVRRCCC